MTSDSPHSVVPSFVFGELFVCVLVTPFTSGKSVMEGTFFQQPLIVDKKLYDIFHVHLCSICMLFYCVIVMPHLCHNLLLTKVFNALCVLE